MTLGQETRWPLSGNNGSSFGIFHNNHHQETETKFNAKDKTDRPEIRRKNDSEKKHQPQMKAKPEKKKISQHTAIICKTNHI